MRWASAAVMLAAALTAHADASGVAGPPVDRLLGPWPVDRLLLPPDFFVSEPQVKREAPRPPGRLLRILVGSDRLPPATRRIALDVFQLLKYGAHAMTGITRRFDPSGRGRLQEPDSIDDPWGVPCADQEPDHAAASPGPGVALLRPSLLDVDALPAFQPGEPTAGTFWIHLDAGWPAQAETAALDAAPRAVGTDPSHAVRLLMHSTSLAFLAAIVLVPAGCSFAAGAVNGRSRDGPRRPRTSSSRLYLLRPSCIFRSRHTSTPTASIPATATIV